MDAEPVAAKLEQEIEELKRLLEASDAAGKESAKQIDQLTKRAAEDTAELEHLRDKLKSFREDASRFSREDDRKIRHLQREKKDADKKITRLKSEVAELRSVIEQYVGQIQSGLEGGAASALITELDLVRKQAEEDVARMREQLRERERIESEGSAELEELRRKLDGLEQREEESSKSLADTDGERKRLTGEIEQQRRESQRLQRALSAASKDLQQSERIRKEQVEINRQLESSLDGIRSELEHLREKEVLAETSRVEKSVGNGASSVRQRGGLGAALIGAAVAFLVAEGISVTSGKGELISGLIADNRQEEQAPDFPRLEISRPEPAQETIDRKPEKMVVSNPVRSEPEPVQPEQALPQPEQATPQPEQAPPQTTQKPATGTSLRDQLKVGGEGPVMIYIRGGVFEMGQKHDQLATDERPLHRVRLKDFAIGKNEVTFSEYLRFARSTGRRVPWDQEWGRGQRPVINISWLEAKAYTRWLSDQTGENYRLPTEAEWEYAAGGDTDSFYWWGFELEENRASCFDCGSRWDGKSTAPVGSFPANPFSLNDTAGNVMEWVEDCYHSSYLGAPKDGSAWEENDCDKRVARGGAFNKPGDSLHTTRRFNFQTDTRLPTLGFRVAREVD